MKRATYKTIPLTLAAAVLSAHAASMEFEVATVKPTPPPDMSGGKVMLRFGCSNDPGRVSCSGITIKDMLTRGYSLKPYQITGPGWIESERWDVTAKIPDGAPADKLPEMWQNLLASRFHVSTRRETKDLNIYALIVGKNGPKLTPAEESDKPMTFDAPDGSKVKLPSPPGGGGGIGVREQAVDHAGGPGEKARAAIGGGPAGGGPKMGMMVMDGMGKMQLKGSTLGGFSDMLTRMMDRPVLDFTNVEGKYDITLEVSMEDMVGMKRMAAGPGMMMHDRGPDGPAPEGNPRASIFSAVQQLGLKLEPRKAPTDFLVVEKVDRPTEN
jgi:uncharacterized protein (TIGR03435 family)